MAATSSIQVLTNLRNMGPLQFRVSIPSNLTCPNCWDVFSADAVHYITEGPNLRNDPVLGSDAALRFLPSRFHVDGSALDAEGFSCNRLACPVCHLELPRAIAESSPLFISIAGAPACGKSFLLTAMSWKLRSTLPQEFGLTFVDADPRSNAILNEYEALQFASNNREEPVKIEKTQERGQAYRSVIIKGQLRQYPQPFLFSVRPKATRCADSVDQRKKSRLICLYDNAGESFQPGKDSLGNPVTRHLAKYKCLMFLVDPTQDANFRRSCQPFDHPQLHLGTTTRQDVIVNETADRVRRLLGLRAGELDRRLCIVAVTKWDTWQPMFGEFLAPPWTKPATNSAAVLRSDIIQDVSSRLQRFLAQRMPEFVSAVEAFSRRVIYVPVSATGCAPVIDETQQILGFRPKDLKPVWVEVPFLLALANERNGLIDVGRARNE